MFRYALDSDIDHNCVNSRGDSVIQVAILNGHYNIANLILSRSDEDIPSENFGLWFEAAAGGDMRSLKTLYGSGVHVDLPNKQGSKVVVLRFWDKLFLFSFIF